MTKNIKQGADFSRISLPKGKTTLAYFPVFFFMHLRACVYIILHASSVAGRSVPTVLQLHQTLRSDASVMSLSASRSAEFIGTETEGSLSKNIPFAASF